MDAKVIGGKLRQCLRHMMPMPRWKGTLCGIGRANKNCCEIYASDSRDRQWIRRVRGEVALEESRGSFQAKEMQVGME